MWNGDKYNYVYSHSSFRSCCARIVVTHIEIKPHLVFLHVCETADGNSMFLRNAGIDRRVYTATKPEQQHRQYLFLSIQCVIIFVPGIAVFECKYRNTSR
jgi:hypothetical protein